MHEEKLCAGRARFITGDHVFERSLLASPQDMLWPELEVGPESREEAWLFVEKPKFTWDIFLMSQSYVYFIRCSLRRHCQHYENQVGWSRDGYPLAYALLTIWVWESKQW